MKEGIAERFILVVEANLEHVRTITAAFAETSKYQILAIANGQEALDFLYRKGEYSTAARPDLILLDLNLPGEDGQIILAEIKASSQLRRIPVVVLTASASEEDVLKTYELQGNCYVIKSSDLDQLSRIVKRIEAFWLEIVTLPLE